MKLKTKFQDEDFDFGEAVEANIYYGGSGRIKVITEPTKGGIITFYFESLKGLNEMFEDYEEPKEYWYVSCDGRALKATTDEDDYNEKHIAGHKEIGNHFEPEEEAEKAAEKLKAWKRLKDKGFRFTGWTIDDGLRISICTNFEGDNIYSESEKEIRTNLDLLFGGEE